MKWNIYVFCSWASSSSNGNNNNSGSKIHSSTDKWHRIKIANLSWVERVKSSSSNISSFHTYERAHNSYSHMKLCVIYLIQWHWTCCVCVFFPLLTWMSDNYFFSSYRIVVLFLLLVRSLACSYPLHAPLWSTVQLYFFLFKHKKKSLFIYFFLFALLCFVSVLCVHLITLYESNWPVLASSGILALRAMKLNCIFLPFVVLLLLLLLWLFVANDTLTEQEMNYIIWRRMNLFFANSVQQHVIIFLSYKLVIRTIDDDNNTDDDVEDKEKLKFSFIIDDETLIARVRKV